MQRSEYVISVNASPLELSSKELFTLHLGDNALIIGHRNSEWCGHGPVLEQDIALTNIALDQIGQARYFYQHAALLINARLGLTGTQQEISEDSLAYLRDARDFRNCLLVEQPNGDWGTTILRQFFFSSYQHALYEKLRSGEEAQLAAIAEKSLKELSYHVRWSGEWVIRLGDGTGESRSRMLSAFEQLWPYTGELFTDAPYEADLGAHINPDKALLKEHWLSRVESVLTEATILDTNQVEHRNAFQHQGGKTGHHSEHLGYLLAELQYVQRAYPNCEW